MLEELFLYYPVRYPGGEWDTSTLPFPVEDVPVETTDGERLHGWFVPARAEDAPTVLYLHGNGGNISHRAAFLGRLRRLPADVLAIDYRGYGRSTGKPHEAGLYRDAEAAHRYLIETRGVPPERLVLFGKSLGGAVAIDLATRAAAAGLIVQSTLTGVRAMAPHALRWLARNRFDALSRIRRVRCPKLFIHARGDRLIPFAMGRALHAAAPEPKHFLDLGEDLDHNDTMEAGADYDRALRAFLARYAGTPAADRDRGEPDRRPTHDAAGLAGSGRPAGSGHDDEARGEKGSDSPDVLEPSP